LPHDAVDAHGWRCALHGAQRSTFDARVAGARRGRAFRAQCRDARDDCLELRVKGLMQRRPYVVLG